MRATAVLRSVSRGVRAFLLDNTLEMLPARKHWRHYSWARFRRDLTAGFNVSLLSIAQGLAFASLAGVPIAHGLTCAAVASLVGPLLASSRHTILGPTNATSFLVFSGLASLPPAERAEMLPVLVFFAGALQVVGAYFRLADLLHYVSRTVIVGYLAGSALLIIAAQMEGVVGLPRPDDQPRAATFFGLVRQAVTHVQEMHWSSLLIALLTWVVYAGLRWKRPGLPAFAIALVAGSLAGGGLRVGGVEVETLQGFTLHDLLPVMPDLSDPAVWDRLNPLFGLTFAIAFLSSLENSIMAKALASRTGDRLDSNQEMLSVGAANLACSFLSGMPASGSLVRSALNYTSGAATQASSLIAGAICAVAALTLGGVVAYIPRAALAILVMCVAMSLFNWRHLRLCFRATRSDASTLVITFIATLLMPLQVAIFVGVGVSILLYLRKAARPELVEYEFNAEGALAEAADDKRQHPAISIVHVEGDLFFGAAELFRQQIQRLAQDPSLRVIILRMKYARHLDATSAMALEDLLRFMRAKHRYLLLSGVTKDVYRVLKNSGLVELLGRENIFPSSVQKPNLATRHALKRAQELLGHQKADIRIFHEPGRPRPA